MSKFSKGYNSKKNNQFFFSEVIQVIYSSFPIRLSSLKAIASTVLEIFCLQGENAEIFKGP